MSKTTSIVIVSYNTGAALWICIYRTLQLEGVKEIIIVNNGNEGSVEFRLKQLSLDNPRIQFITGHGNVGFSNGCNLGAQHATGDTVFFLNPDAVILERDGILRLNALFDSGLQPAVGMVGGVLRNDDGTEQRASRRNLITPQNALYEGLGLHRILRSLPTINITKPLKPEPTQVGAVSGACILMERERFNQIGRFDEDYFLHVEDMDLCLRVNRAGGGVWIHPGVNILHFCSTSDVQAIFIDRMKTKGFSRYFALHYHSQYIWRAVVQAAVTAKLAVRIALSFLSEMKSPPALTDAYGIRRVQAIVRGFDAVKDAGKPGQGRTVLVTGSSSQIGLFTIGRLLGQGYRVVALVHRTNIGFFHPNLAWVRANLSNAEAVEQALRPFQFDSVIHCAPVWLAAPVIPVFFSGGAKRVVAFSSTSIDGKSESGDAAERKIVKRLQEGEETLKAQAAGLGVGVTLLRPTLIYGAGLDRNITRVAESFDASGSFYVEKPALGKRAPVHADDLAAIAIRALDVPESIGQTYNVQGGEELSYIDMVSRVGRTLGKPFKVRSLSGLSMLCRIFHPILPQTVPSASVALRMQQDLLFPDERIASQFGIQPRAFLHDGALDIGICPEEVCRKLLEIYVDNAAYFASPSTETEAACAATALSSPSASTTSDV